MTITNTPSSSSSSSSALNLDTLPPPPSPTQTPSNPSSASATHPPAQSSAGSSLSDPSSVEDRRRRESSTRAWVAEQERRIEMEIIRTICSGRGDSLKPNSGTAITVGEHYVCVRSYDGSDPNYRTWEWHGHVMTGEDNGYMPERIYGSYLERLTEESWCDEEEDEESTEDSTFPIVIGNVNLRLKRFN